MTERAFVAGELRGYRQFHLDGDGLHPVVHRAAGPWHAGLEQARCLVGEDHDAPAAGCGCGLYACYLPGSATVALGAVNAVVAARGRCLLGDRGFRAARARIEAVALSPAIRCRPMATARVRRLLADRYPATQVYASTRRMLKEHPPQDVAGLGIALAPDRSRQYRAVAAALWLSFVVTGYALAFLPADVMAAAQARWPLLVLAFLAWQAALIWLFVRLMALQGPPPPR
ncbi:MAG: hypothetical protein JWN87_1681 [Frankiales bacterium]|nr:hypothetical protein [Frankiales bacterium]